jgi:cysteine desulfurase
MRRIYLDNNATTPVLPEVMATMLPYFAEDFGNASSIHQNGQATKAAVEDARDSVARLIGARASEMVFTSGGTEADNLAVFGIVSAGDHIIASAIEHHAVLLSCRHAASLGCELTEIPVDRQGLIDPEDVRRALRPNTRLISIMLANNETGVLQPVEEIGKLAHERDIRFHTDAVQAAGKVSLSVSQLGCDLLSISGHKMHAPQGVGALYVRKGIRLRPRLHGGAHERSRRAGTENVPGIAGLGKAAALAVTALDSGHDRKLCALRDRLERGIVDRVEECEVNSGAAARIPNTTSIRFDFVDGEAMVIALDLKGIAVSSGAACSSGASEPSHVLTAMGLTLAQARSTVRFSLGRQNTEEDVDFAIDAVTQTVARLRELSPNYRREMVRS